MVRKFPISPSIDPMRTLSRYVAAAAHTTFKGSNNIARSAAELFGSAAVEEVTKAAVSPASSSGGGWGSQLAGVGTGAVLDSLRPASASANLLNRGQQFDLRGFSAVALPRLSADWPDPHWVVEGDASPVQRGNFDSVTLGPSKKLMSISIVTAELLEAGESVEQTIRDSMRVAAARNLDATVLSSLAATAARPAGLLVGSTPITAATGGGSAAMSKDISALVAAVHAAGGGANLVVIAAPPQAIAVQLLSGSELEIPVIVAPNLAAGTAIVLDVAALAVGYGPSPRLDVARSVTVHMDDAPQPISAPGTPNTISAPVRDTWQTDCVAIRLILQIAYILRAPMIAHVTGATW